MNKPFLINFLSLNASSLYNRILNFILFFFLIRFLTPAEYGIYTVAWAFVGILAPFIDFGTTTYGLINLPGKEKSHMKEVISFRFYLALLLFLVTILLAYAFNYSGAALTAILLTSVTILANMWSGTYLLVCSIRQKNYLPASVSVIFNTILIASLIILLFIRGSLIPLFIVISVSYLVYGIVNYVLTAQLTPISFSINFEAWRKIAASSVIFVFIAFFAGLYFKLDVLLLQSLKSAREVGVYSAGYKFFEAFIFIASTYNFVAAPVLSKLHRSERNSFGYKVAVDSLMMFCIGVCGVIGVYVFGPIILPTVLRADFAASFVVLKIVILALPLLFVTTVTLNAIYILKKSLWIVGLFGAMVAFNLIANYTLIPIYSYLASAWITVAAEMINMIVTSIMVIYLFHKK